MDNSLIGVINDMQSALSSAGSDLTFSLPQIAIIGNQSAGKSSVLENIVRKDFLPRGTGIVTRRPLVLQLVRDETTDQDWAQFGHKPGVIFHDFHQVREEISIETDRVTGNNKGISPWPINLRVHSASVIDLTLVDLPGMTKVPVGDQPHDIENQIRDMLLTFVTSPCCLILAVCPANADLATADAIKLAQQVDPTGERTLGVLTKLDLMDEGTDARGMLQNKIIPLRYGWVGVVNRGQKDIMGNKDVNSALNDEVQFFQNHPAYKEMKDVLGTAYLCKMLNEQLTMHIARNLPNLKIKLRHQVEDLRRQLLQFESEFDFNMDDPHWMAKAAVCLAITFGNHFRHELLGGDPERVLSLETMNTGTRLMTHFTKTYSELLMDTEMTQESVMKREIGYAIQNILGVRTGLFTPDKAFDLVVRSQLDKLEEPTLALLEMVHELMRFGLRESLEPLKAYPAFSRMIEHKASYILSQQMDITTQRATTLLLYEKAYINTKHEDFVGFNYAEQKAYCRVLKRRLPGKAVITKGYLAIMEGSLKANRRYFFTLTPDALTWYTDDTENERVYIIPIDETLKLQDKQADNRFTVYSQSNVNIYRDRCKIELMAPDYANMDMWKRSLSQVGVFADSATSMLVDAPQSISGDILSSDDPWLERQIESLWILVNSYMNIVCKTLTDLVPKCIVHSAVKTTVFKLEKELIADVSRITELEELFEMDEEDKNRRDSMKKSLEACESALESLRCVQLPKISIQSNPNYIPTPKTSMNAAQGSATASSPNLSSMPPAVPTKPSLPPKPSKPSTSSGNSGMQKSSSTSSFRESNKIVREIKKIDSGQRSQFYDKI